jgi:hypothetical protein
VPHPAPPTHHSHKPGAGPIRIKETQQLSWLDGGATIKIVSVPELQIAYAKALKTAAELLIRETSAGVQIDVAVQVGGSLGVCVSGLRVRTLQLGRAGGGCGPSPLPYR